MSTRQASHTASGNMTTQPTSAAATASEAEGNDPTSDLRGGWGVTNNSHGKTKSIHPSC